MTLNYIKIRDYELQNLSLSENKTNELINKYGLLRLRYLKENNKILYTTLLKSI